MGSGAWWATVHGVTRVGHNSATKPPPRICVNVRWDRTSFLRLEKWLYLRSSHCWFEFFKTCLKYWQTPSYTTIKPKESWQIKRTNSKPTKLKLINVISDAIWQKLIQLLETFTSSNWMWFFGAWHRWPTICCTMIQLTYNLSLRHCTLEGCRLSVACWHVSFAPHSIHFFN